MTQGQRYSNRAENNEHEAVRILDLFTKSFCIDKSVKNDLAFRCSECPFETKDRICLCKVFKHKFYPDYKEFGSMGDL